MRADLVKGRRIRFGNPKAFCGEDRPHSPEQTQVTSFAWDVLQRTMQVLWSVQTAIDN
jgi:hypothetical protein